jgi:hypothetical protein
MDRSLQKWLLEGEPLPEGTDLDALIEAELPAPPPPADLFEKTLAQVEATPQPRATAVAASAKASASVGPQLDADVGRASVPAAANTSMRRWIAAAGLALAAAVALMVALPGDPEVGDPRDFVPRGDGTSAPSVDLFVAVRTSGGDVARLKQDFSYQAGDTLVFRYDLDRAANLALIRADENGAQVLHTTSAPAGTADLQTTGGAVGYELERGEGSAVFALISSEQPLTTQLDALRGLDPEAVCAAARASGLGCSAVAVGDVR